MAINRNALLRSQEALSEGELREAVDGDPDLQQMVIGGWVSGDPRLGSPQNGGMQP